MHEIVLIEWSPNITKHTHSAQTENKAHIMMLYGIASSLQITNTEMVEWEDKDFIKRQTMANFKGIHIKQVTTS